MPVLTRSQTKMWNARNAKQEKRLLGEWEECYYMTPFVDALVGNYPHLKQFRSHCAPDADGNPIAYSTVYYQTYGGGGEGGYFVMHYHNEAKNQKGVCGIYEVHRARGEPFKVRANLSRIGARLEYCEANEEAGVVAQVRYSYTAPN